MSDRVYACIDLKSFYASVECVERGLDPMTAMLAVADPDREEATICLAITPAMKRLGIKNRCRVFEIPPNVKYIMAKPRMRLYMEKSAEIYSVYLKYISPDDIHVYSIDECFIDLTPYLKLYRKSPRELVKLLMSEVKSSVGIPSSAGVGTNLFLAKVGLDILAKKSADGIAELDRASFIEKLSHHRPITDVWNIGKGTADTLSHMGIYDLSGVREANESTLYRKFGVNAEYLIDHAYGRESCTIADIKKYRPRATSISHSQVLFRPYSFDETRLILDEMIEVSVLEMIEKRLSTDHISLSVGYERTGRFGSPECIIPKPTGGSEKLTARTNSLKRLKERFGYLYKTTTSQKVPVRRLAIGLGNLIDERYIDIDMFTDTAALDREHALLKAIVNIKDKFGKNAIVKGSSFEEHSTERMRNTLVGGHNE